MTKSVVEPLLTTPMPLIENTTRLPTGGFDREHQPHVSDLNTWYDLKNLRPSNGALIQTPPIVSKVTLSKFAAEADSPTRYMAMSTNAAGTLKYLVGNEKNLRFVDCTTLSTQTEIPYVSQTVVPTTTTQYGRALLYGINSTDFGAANDQFDVVIEAGGATFKWRKNGGAYTTGVAIGPAVALAGTSLFVSFYALTGYTAADTWSWKRIAFPTVTTYPTQQVRGVTYQKDVYLAGYDRTIMRVRNNMAMTVGYTPTYGKYVEVFYNHLVVGQFAQAQGSTTDPYVATTTPWQIGWSDLNNPDAFFATLANEADEYTVPAGDVAETSYLGITGLGKIGNYLAIYLPTNIHLMSYVGLPNVMQIDPNGIGNGIGSFFQNGLVVTPKGHFFLGQDNVYFFNGATVTQIGNPVQSKLFGEFVPADDTYYQKLYGYYDIQRTEVVWHYWTKVGAYYQAKQLIYQIDHDRFFFRDMPSGQISTDLLCATHVYSYFQRQMYGGVQALYIDYLSGIDAISGVIKDIVASNGTGTYAQPYAETQDFIYGDLGSIKEFSQLYIDADYATASGNLTAYFQARNFASTAVALTAQSDVWTPTIGTRWLSLPQASGNVARFGFKFTGTTPIDCILKGFNDGMYNGKAQQ